ncbi:hypothetical protein AKJ16_DCAP14704, partial [Drosera capensis]
MILELTVCSLLSVLKSLNIVSTVLRGSFLLSRARIKTTHRSCKQLRPIVRVIDLLNSRSIITALDGIAYAVTLERLGRPPP